MIVLKCAAHWNPLSHTLTGLTISLNPFSSRADGVEEGGVWIEGGRGIGSLAFLSRLTKLEITLPVLLSWEGDTGLGLKDVLPFTLEDMCIRDEYISYTGNVSTRNEKSRRFGAG